MRSPIPYDIHPGNFALINRPITGSGKPMLYVRNEIVTHQELRLRNFHSRSTFLPLLCITLAMN